MALKMSNAPGLQHRRLEGALAAPGVFVWLRWQRGWWQHKEVPAGAGLFRDHYTQLKDAAPHHAAHQGPVSCSRRSCLALQQKLQCLASPVPWDQQCLPPLTDMPRMGEG